MATTKIYIILDRSGSMDICKNDTIGGFNSFIKTQKNITEDNANISLYQFDNHYDVVYENKNIQDVPLLTNKTFIPRGGTALLDAIGKTINNIGSKKDNESIIVVILTDGEENSSKEYTKSHINDLIKNKRELGWEFVFIGANQDAIKEAQKIGIDADAAMDFCQNGKGVSNAFDSLSVAIKRTRSTPYKKRKENKLHFTQEERENSMQSN